MAMALPMPMPVSGLAAGNGGLVQQVIAQQMQLMQQQLALLSAAPTVPASVALAVPPAEQSTPGTTAAVSASNPVAPTPVQAPVADEPVGAIKYDVKKAFGAIARIHTQSKEPTDRQKARLNAFIRRYTERTKASKAFTEKNRPHMADPRVVNGFRPVTKELTYQVVIERSKGSRMWDIDGNEYVDVLNGLRHELVRLAGRLHPARRCARSGREGLRDRPAAPAGRRGEPSSSASSPASSAPRCATPAPRP